jgi:hypothetical protein
MSTSVYCFVVGKSGCVLSLLLSATHVHSLIDYISANRDDINIQCGLFNDFLGDARTECDPMNPRQL